MCGLYTELKYAVVVLISFLLVCNQASTFFLSVELFSALLLLVDCITLQDFILDSKSCRYHSSKTSKSLRACGKLSPPVLNDATGSFLHCSVVTPLPLQFCGRSLGKRIGILRGYTASYIASKAAAWDVVVYK